jgi:hypothetical protein
MSLSLAILLPGLILVGLGSPLLLASPSVGRFLKGFPHSRTAAYICFGAGSGWFLWNVWNLPEADFGGHRVLLICIFGVVAASAFNSVPDLLAVRGLCVLVLVGSMPMLMAGYMNYDYWPLYAQKILLYVGVSAAIWLGAQPWRLRDCFEWLLFKRLRARVCGCVLLAYGVFLIGISISYNLQNP